MISCLTCSYDVNFDIHSITALQCVPGYFKGPSDDCDICSDNTWSSSGGACDSSREFPDIL